MHIPYTKTGTLTPGIHTLSLADFKSQFGSATAIRRELYFKLWEGLKNLKASRVMNVYLDGSYVTDKKDPNDIDGCWDAHKDVNVAVLDPVFLDFANRDLMRDKYGVDFFLSQTIEGKSGEPFTAFFQTDRDGVPKGIVHICIEKESFTA